MAIIRPKTLQKREDPKKKQTKIVIFIHVLSCLKAQLSFY